MDLSQMVILTTAWVTSCSNLVIETRGRSSFWRTWSWQRRCWSWSWGSPSSSQQVLHVNLTHTRTLHTTDTTFTNGNVQTQLWRQEINVWRANGLNYLARSTNFTRKWIKTGSWSGFICRSLDDEKSLKHPNLQNCYFFSILTSAFQSCCCCWGAAGCGCCCCELLPQGSSQSSETLLRAGPELKVFPLGTVHP